MNPLRRSFAEEPAPPPWSEVFGRRAPLEVDVGFGRGHFLVDRARQVPGHDLVGLEIRKKWVAIVKARLEREGIGNVRVFEAEAQHFLSTAFRAGEVRRFYVFFPDPWWKRRHHKRRLLTPELAALISDRLSPRGELFFQTDVREYAERALEILDATPGLTNVAGPGQLGGWEAELPHSPRERRYRRDGVAYYQMRHRKTG